MNLPVIENSDIILEEFGVRVPISTFLTGPVERTDCHGFIYLVCNFTITFEERSVSFITVMNESNGGNYKWISLEKTSEIIFHCVEDINLSLSTMNHTVERRISPESSQYKPIYLSSSNVDVSNHIKELVSLDTFKLNRGKYEVDFRLSAIDLVAGSKKCLIHHKLKTYLNETKQRIIATVESEPELIDLLKKCLEDHIIDMSLFEVMEAIPLDKMMEVPMEINKSNPVDSDKLERVLKPNIANKPILFSYIGDVEVDGFSVISGSNINTIKLAESIAGVILDSRNFIHLHKQLNSIIEYNNYALYFLWDGEKLEVLTHSDLKNVVRTTYENLD